MPIQADDASLSRLLELQSEDSEIRRLEERKANLPEAQRLRELNEQLDELGADLAIATKQQEEAAREQSKIEGEMGLVDQKITKEEGRMYSGGVSNPKELGSLQAEVEMLKRKRGVFEDQLLEVMVQKDDYEAMMARLSGERDELQTEADALSAKVNELTADLDAQLHQHNSTRIEVAASISEDLRALYEQLLEQKHGVGAAALESGTCQGCHTKLPAREVERLRNERGLQRCDNCRRILVVV
jgi:uncharacterized protein